MTPKPHEESVRLRIILIHPFAPSHNEELGLQDKSRIVHQVAPRAAGDLAYDLVVRADMSGDDDALDFRGPWVQGPRGGRFVYISWLRYPDDGGEPHWVRRMKLSLSSITREQIRQTSDADGVLEWRVRGRDEDGMLPGGTAYNRNVALIDEGWVVRQAGGFDPLTPA